MSRLKQSGDDVYPIGGSPLGTPPGSMSLQDQIKNLPLTSGVYLMKDKDGRVIYIGKAVSLRKRVQSYFRRKSVNAEVYALKLEKLVSEICSIEHICTNGEAEALILEASLVKQYAPKFNVDLRDDKSYPCIQITCEDFPRISIERPRIKNPRYTYYGPYVNPMLVREALNIIRRIFHFRTCQPFPDKACLDYHMGLCAAPCIANISKEDYARNIRSVRLILEGKKDELYQKLTEDMQALSKAKRYEEASAVRDQLRALGALYSGTPDVNYFKEAEQLQRALNLPRTPQRVETIDISNIMGEFSVGSMVSFLRGKPDKSNYRRFRIKTVEGIDDCSMIAEVVRRRYSRLQKEGQPFPDLIIIDGGKGQLAAALGQLKAMDLDIPIAALAKREEEIFCPGKRVSIRLAADSLGLKLLQRMRDEAHRFAVAYHRLLRKKNFVEIHGGRR